MLTSWVWGIDYRELLPDALHQLLGTGRPTLARGWVVGKARPWSIPQLGNMRQPCAERSEKNSDSRKVKMLWCHSCKEMDCWLSLASFLVRFCFCMLCLMAGIITGSNSGSPNLSWPWCILGDLDLVRFWSNKFWKSRMIGFTFLGMPKWPFSWGAGAKPGGWRALN